MSQAWEEFDRDFLNATTHGQREAGFPEYLLNALSPDERTRAIAVLICRLDGRDDWPIRAMAHFGVTAAAPRLRELLRVCESPVMQAVIATANYELTQDSRMENIVLAVATLMPWLVPQSYRIEAIHCLGRFKTETAARTLLGLATDPDTFIAHNAKLVLEIGQRPSQPLN